MSAVASTSASPATESSDVLDTQSPTRLLAQGTVFFGDKASAFADPLGAVVTWGGDQEDNGIHVRVYAQEQPAFWAEAVVTRDAYERLMAMAASSVVTHGTLMSTNAARETPITCRGGRLSDAGKVRAVLRCVEWVYSVVFSTDDEPLFMAGTNVLADDQIEARIVLPRELVSTLTPTGAHPRQS